MYELSTPKEIIIKLIQIIEDERKSQKIQQKELCLKASIPFPTYKDFIYKHKSSFENIIKLLIALKLFDNINGLLKQKEYKTLQDIKNKKNLPKRINK